MDFQDEMITIFCLYYGFCVGITMYYLNKKLIVITSRSNSLQESCERTCFIFSLGLISPVFIPFHIVTNHYTRYNLINDYNSLDEDVSDDYSDDQKKSEEELLSDYVEIMRATV